MTCLPEGENDMSEIDELKEKIEHLEQRVNFLEETIQTLADINKSNQVGEYIANRQRAMAVSRLVNSTSKGAELNTEVQMNILQNLEIEKAAADERIQKAIKESSQSNIENRLEKEFSYQEIEGGIEILGYNGFETQTMVIPNKIDDKCVVSIGKEAFINMGFKRVALPNKCTEIKESAFRNCTELESVTLPESLIVLGPRAFCDCRTLSSVFFDKNLTEIGVQCFLRTGLKEVLLPPKVRALQHESFTLCRDLKKVILNENLEQLDTGAFQDTAIRKVILPKSLKLLKGESGYCRTTRRSFIAFPFDTDIEIAVTGMRTEFEYLPSTVTIYCLPGSIALQQARNAGAVVHPLSDFTE